MKAIGKIATGAAAAALMTVSAAPAQAQWGGRYYDRDRGVDAGDIITGVAVIGGIAAILGAINNDSSRYGYSNRYRYRDNYRNAVNSCGYQAQRYARGGRISVTDVDRAGGNRFVVRGIVDQAYGGYGYDRHDRGYGYDRYNRGYGRTAFSCYAHANGRILDFNINRY